MRRVMLYSAPPSRLTHFWYGPFVRHSPRTCLLFMPVNDSPVIEVQNLSKSYGEVQAVAT
jgi:hypothetical protein